MYRIFPTVTAIRLVSLLACGAYAQDEDFGYPPGTLTPNIDLGLQVVPVDVPAKYRGIVAEGLTVNLPPGFSASIFAAGLRGPRDMEVSPDGVLHVALPGTGQIVALPDRDGDGVADEHIVVLDNLRVSDSVVFNKGDMYVGERHQVIRATDADGDGIYEDREVFIADLPWEGWHSSKTIIFDEPNEKLYVGVPSPCDLCRMEPGNQFAGPSTTETVPYRPERGTVLQFNADGTGQRIFATGVRNVVGMDLHPLTNELWGTNNGHDEEGRSRPPEWIDVLQDGDFQGYPFVHSHLVWNDFTIDRYHPMLPITREDTLLAMTQKKPVALVPAHWAPMRIHFYTGSQFPEMYRNAAFVAFHAGRAKLSSHPGYKVQALFSDPDGSNARMADFITGFQTGTTTSSVWGFPHGVTSDGEGSLYVSSDRRNEVILKITHSLLHGSWEHDLPRSVLLATPVNLRATVRLERGNENGGEPRVTADLSAFGGPANLTLTAVGDGEYTLDEQVVAETMGAHSVIVRIEQESGEHTEVLQFAHIITVLPASDVLIFDDATAPGWTLEHSSLVTPDTAVRDRVYVGDTAIALRASPTRLAGWNIEFTLDHPFAFDGYRSLRFAFHPGDAQVPDNGSFLVRVNRRSLGNREPTGLYNLNYEFGKPANLLGDGGDSGVPGFEVDFQKPEWQVVDIPLDILHPTGTIELIRFSGNLAGTFYLDDIRLVMATESLTAVEVEELDKRPGNFVVEQNRPNPFNSDTVIRYELPRAAVVDLSVYNLVGQQVAQLVRRSREAGSHAVRWDGRDDQGQPLAGGVYLYRLRAGGQMQVRKLLLLK